MNEVLIYIAYSMFSNIIYSGGDYPIGFSGEGFQNDLFLALRSVLTVAAVVAIVYCGATLVWSSDDRVISRARTWIAAIMFALVLAYGAPAMLSSMDWDNSVSTDSMTEPPAVNETPGDFRPW